MYNLVLTLNTLHALLLLTSGPNLWICIRLVQEFDILYFQLSPHYLQCNILTFPYFLLFSFFFRIFFQLEGFNSSITFTFLICLFSLLLVARLIGSPKLSYQLHQLNMHFFNENKVYQGNLQKSTPHSCTNYEFQ